MSNFSQIGLSHWSTIILSYYRNTGTRDFKVVLSSPLFFWTSDTEEEKEFEPFFKLLKHIWPTFEEKR